MSSVTSDRYQTARRPEEDWQGRYSPPDRRQESNAAPWGLIVAGVVIGGLAAMAWYEFGPDLRRYIKMELM
jgi:hypothetical protein